MGTNQFAGTRYVEFTAFPVNLVTDVLGPNNGTPAVEIIVTLVGGGVLVVTFADGTTSTINNAGGLVGVPLSGLATDIEAATDVGAVLVTWSYP
ncbi:hypothetical protein LCGC14_1340600 [marine sediment metagenome]|uniref:Uncharacterized protein n=1 Tax=marine sediment metagenome TaxID=412755 RepID=A0A0F9KEK7_9ZZZZ